MDQAFLENRILIEVNNESDHDFHPDGEWLRAGEWKPDCDRVIPARAMRVLELRPASVAGVAGVMWWVGGKDHDVYLSIALTHPRMQGLGLGPCFSSWAGLPPDDLKSELDQLPRLEQNRTMRPEGRGCSWTTGALGNMTLVELTIFKDQARHVPQVATSPAAAAAAAATNDTAGGASSSSATAQAPPPPNAGYPAAAGPAAARAPSSAPGAAAQQQQQQQHSDCTTLVATGASSTPDEPTDEEAQQEMSKFFAQTRPKDALDGLQRGLKTAGGSILAGVGTVVASSVSGGASGGGFGFVKGLGTGLLGGAAIAVGGTVCGVTQIGRGIANTPEAMWGRRTQRVWDQELGQWVDIDLVALESEVNGEASDDEDGPSLCSADGGGSGEVVDREFYDLLKAEPTATASEIKKAYYKEARICHPDKNPGDADAKVKFQKLADAYQVLSDPANRKKYDREGKEGIQEGNVKMDPAVFFSLLFGSDRFLPWIGELQLAMQTDQIAKMMERGADDGMSPEGTENSDAKLKKKQHRREVRCACNLRDKLDRLVYGRDPEGFEEQMRLEASDLAQAQFGPELLSALAEIYLLRAEIYLADELVGRFSLTKRYASLKHSGATMRHQFSFVQNVAGSLFKVKKVHDVATKMQPIEGQEGQTDEVQQRKVVEDALDEALPIFLQTAWAAVVTDIDGTIKEVGRKLLKDKAVSWQIRVRRAQALRTLGEILMEEGAKAAQAQGDQASTLMSSDAAKALLQEALVGSCREKK